MKNQKNIRTFVISTKGIFGSKKILDHVRKSMESKKIKESDADIIYNDIKTQMDNGK